MLQCFQVDFGWMECMASPYESPPRSVHVLMVEEACLMHFIHKICLQILAEQRNSSFLQCAFSGLVHQCSKS